MAKRTTKSTRSVQETPSQPQNGLDLRNNSFSKKLQSKADKPTITKIDDSAISLQYANNTIYDCGELSELRISMPLPVTVDYLSQVNFTSGTNATGITASSEIKWVGDEIDENGRFVPESNRRYVIMFYSDGSAIRAVVNGVDVSIPTNNE